MICLKLAAVYTHYKSAYLTKVEFLKLDSSKSYSFLTYFGFSTFSDEKRFGAPLAQCYKFISMSNEYFLLGGHTVWKVCKFYYF